VQATVSVRGYSLASWGASQSEAFVSGVATSLGVSPLAVIIRSTTAGDAPASAGRRRALQAPGPYVVIGFVVVSATAGDTDALLASSVRALTGSPAGLASLVAALHAAGLPAVSGVEQVTAPLLESLLVPDAPASSGISSDITIVIATCSSVGGSALIALAVAAVVKRAALRRWWHLRCACSAPVLDEEMAKPPPKPRYRYDIFLSYRRLDEEIVDLIEDKLCHTDCGMRVFRDVRGHLQGADFDVELLRCMLKSAVFVPVITLGAMRRLRTLSATAVDVTLAEYCMALLLYDTRLIAGFSPLVVGEEQLERRSGKTVLDMLFQNAQFKQTRDKLPHTVPTATWRFVRLTLAAVGIELPAAWEAMTVHDILCGSTRNLVPPSGSAPHVAVPTSGVLIKDCYFLEGDKRQLRLLLREFADKARRRTAVAAAEAAEAGTDSSVVPSDDEAPVEDSKGPASAEEGASAPSADDDDPQPALAPAGAEEAAPPDAARIRRRLPAGCLCGRRTAAQEPPLSELIEPTVDVSEAVAPEALPAAGPEAAAQL
jgi:hypothetical protein